MQTSSVRENCYLVGTVFIRSNEPLATMAAKLSKGFLGGIELRGQEEYIYEEVPAVYAEVAGLRFILSKGKEQHYVFECYPSDAVEIGEKPVRVDISDHLLRSLQTIGQLEVTLN